MYANNVAKVLTDVTVPQKMVKRVLRDNGMQIVKKFSPVKSEYKFQIGDNKRISMLLSEDEFVQKEERLVRNHWVPAVEMRVRNTNLEDVLIKSISDILDMGAKFKQFRNIK
jgi:hypothetical protein